MGRRLGRGPHFFRVRVFGASLGADAAASVALLQAIAAAGLDRLPHILAASLDRTAPPPYIAANPGSFLGKPSVGDGECVALVKTASARPMPPTGDWRQGETVLGNTSLPIGTAIATFDANGRYLGHTAIYIGQDDNGLTVIDQWNVRQNSTVIDQHAPASRTMPWADPNKAAVDVGSSFHVVR
ncbi:MAG: BPSL0067 family protein [Alphaproteobacteria bacterium]|nr:BPSL0067 family protein [Alphaproteobacteria bacterium]